MAHVGHSRYSDHQVSHQPCDVHFTCITASTLLLCYGGNGHYAPDMRSSSNVLAGCCAVVIACSVFRGYCLQQL